MKSKSTLTYASLAWTAADVQTLAPKMTEKEAETRLIKNAKHLRDRLCELGWQVISDLLAYDGVDTSDSE